MNCGSFFHSLSGLPAGQTLRFLLIVLIPLQTLCAQNNALRGKILFLSSGKTPAIGVEISGTIKQGEQANTVYTTDLGAYQLVFPTAGEGQRVSLVIGDRDADNRQLELVNEKEVESCRIPSNATEEFEIIVAKKGSRDLVAQKYYKIIKTSADLALAETEKQLEAQFRQQEKDYNQIMVLSTKIDQLQKKADSLSIYRDAFDIASINRDNASRRVLRYLDLLDVGKSIQEARDELSIQGAANDLKQGMELVQNGMEELETRSRASQSIFDYADALTCYDTIIHYALRLNIRQENLATYYVRAANIQKELGQYQSALELEQKALTIREQVLADDDPELATSLHNLGITSSYLGDDNKALDYYERALATMRKNGDTLSLATGSIYNSMGTAYDNKGQYQEAIHLHKKSAHIYSLDLEDSESYLIFSYNNLGNSYSHLNEQDSSLKFIKKSLDIAERIKDPLDPNLGIIYNNLASTYDEVGEYEVALGFKEKAMDIFSSIYQDNHPNRAILHNNIALSYRALGKLDLALEHAQKALNMFEFLMPPIHPSIGILNNNIGTIFNSMNQHTSSLPFHKKALEVRYASLDSLDPSVGISLANLGNTYHNLKSYDSALIYTHKALYIYEKALPADHQNFGFLYNNLASLYLDLDQADKALSYFQQSINIRTKKLSPKHPDVLGCMNMMASAFAKLGQSDSALHYHQYAISQLEEVLDSSHYDLLAAYLTYANSLIQLEKDTLALAYQHKTWKIIQAKKNPAKHPSFRRAIDIRKKIFLHRAQKAYEMGQIQHALLSLDTLIASRDTDWDHLSIAMIYTGLCHLHLQQENKAKRIFEECAALFPSDYHIHLHQAIFYAKQHQRDVAMGHLHEAVLHGFHDFSSLESHPGLAHFINDKRFKKLQKQVKNNRPKSLN